MRLLREPLLQFLLLGGGLFAAYELLGPPADRPRERITIDAPVVHSLEQSFEAVWKRPPTDVERRGLIEDHLAEEVLYREAQKLGLDQDDVVIRRRMRQKMEFLLQDSLAQVTPDEAALRAFFDAERDRYRDPDQISFRQIYLGDGRGDREPEQWATLLVRLNGDDPPDAEGLGQGSLLPTRMNSSAVQEIDRTFGEGFADQLRSHPVGRWAGPVRSSYGWHLVLVDGIEPASEPDFKRVRSAVERDYAYQREREAAVALVERLKRGYEIAIGGEVR